MLCVTPLTDPVDPWLTQADIIPGQCPKANLIFKVPTWAPLKVTSHILTLEPCGFISRPQGNIEVPYGGCPVSPMQGIMGDDEALQAILKEGSPSLTSSLPPFLTRSLPPSSPLSFHFTCFCALGGLKLTM